MKLAICLLTADRANYTAATCASLIEHGGMESALYFHADDGSASRDNALIVDAAGFKTVYATARRRGQTPALRAMWGEALAAGCTHILHLENDNEFVSRVPEPFAETCDSMRLYGKFKSRGGAREKTGEHIIGTNVRILWRPSPVLAGWERGVAHWGGLPSITRADLLWRAVRDAERFKDVVMSLQRLDTIRPLENITWHIGDERTPNARLNS